MYLPPRFDLFEVHSEFRSQLGLVTPLSLELVTTLPSFFFDIDDDDLNHDEIWWNPVASFAFCAVESLCHVTSCITSLSALFGSSLPTYPPDSQWPPPTTAR